MKEKEKRRTRKTNDIHFLGKKDKMPIYIGVDNGVTGTVGIITEEKTFFVNTPIIKQQNYTKTKASISRIDVKRMTSLFLPFKGLQPIIKIERPMVNPGRFKATISAIRALESTMCILESLDLDFAFIDSKEWQKALLPGIVGSEELKHASKLKGIELYPEFEPIIRKHGDADGLLIAKYLKMINN